MIHIIYIIYGIYTYVKFLCKFRLLKKCLLENYFTLGRDFKNDGESFKN